MDPNHNRVIGEGYTFDDLLLVPSSSEVLPKNVDLSTKLTKKITLKIPVVSAAMDRVTESNMGIAIARQGGIGIIHKNMPAEKQMDEVDKVKRSESGLIASPITLNEESSVWDSLKIMEKYHISGVPIVRGTRLVGIITNRDLRFITDYSLLVRDVMTKDNLVVAPVGTTLDQAKSILSKSKVEKLLIVDKDFNLKGLITIKDIKKMLQYPNSSKDSNGRLRVGAAVSTSKDVMERISMLCSVHLDVLVIDSAHGHHEGIINLVKKVRHAFPDLDIIAGNVATSDATKDLIEAGASGIKVGIGAGSICTTRIIAGIGVPQVSAVMNCAEMADKYSIPVISDGGIRYSGDITKAIAAGGSSVMLGNLLAGLEESPGDLIFYEGRQFKEYRGMGSLEAIKEGGGERYFQDELDTSKMVPEGIVGRVPYKGKLQDFMYQLLGGLRAGMGYTGSKTIEDLRTKTKFIKITLAGMKESHPHDVSIVREAPNYWIK